MRQVSGKLARRWLLLGGRNQAARPPWCEIRRPKQWPDRTARRRSSIAAIRRFSLAQARRVGLQQVVGKNGNSVALVVAAGKWINGIRIIRRRRRMLKTGRQARARGIVHSPGSLRHDDHGRSRISSISTSDVMVGMTLQ